MLARYQELTAKIDAFFARVVARHAADLRCASGCDRCCHQRLTVTSVEADAIRAHAASLSASERAAIAAAAATAAADRCAALDDAGRCRIYDARPIVCRSHGLPIRMRDARSLPVVTACELNFTAQGPGAAAPDCILDQELVSTMLALVDRDHRAHAGTAAAATDRVDLATVLTDLATTDTADLADD